MSDLDPQALLDEWNKYDWAAAAPALVAALMEAREAEQRCRWAMERSAARTERAEAEAARYREALEMYADPASYHAMTFYMDRPCGAFETEDDLHPYPEKP